MVGTRDTPRDIENAPNYSANGVATTPNMSVVPGLSPDVLSPEKAKDLGRECYSGSTSWLNSGKRSKWNDSLRAFQGLHMSGSKYLSTDYKHRSKLFIPKSRSIVRAAEAATAAAFFANEDVVNITAQDDDDQQQQASAEIMQRLLQYRLTKTIPWFLTVCGARQDADVMGVCIGKAYWKYSEEYSHTEDRVQLDPTTGLPVLNADTGQAMTEQIDVYRRAVDHPWVDLLASENFRFDSGADWRNPVATSPYLIELVPMYACDIQARVKSGEWLPVSDSAIYGSTDLDDDVTRRSREQGRVPGKDNDAYKPMPFQICWVRENIVRWGGQDWHFFSLSSGGELLTNPRPLKEVYLQGVRPYVCGFVIPEAHKVYPSSRLDLIRDLQTYENDVVNLRLDNVKGALNPRQIIRNGSQIDPNDLRTYIPGKVVLAENPKEDIVWDRPPDATAGSYQEQDRIGMMIDELTGGISNASIQGNRQVYEAVGNMQMMQGNAATINEYELRVFAETFVEPIIRQLVKLEQAYESDPVVLAMAGKEAQLFQKFGISEITDFLLKQELTIKVNVGIGATNPEKRLKNFLTAGQALGQMFGPVAAMGANFDEVTKELFSLCGYKDGERFFLPGFDAQKAMQGMASGKQQEGDAASGGTNQLDLQQEQLKQMADWREAQLKAKTDMDRAMLQSQTQLQIEAMRQQAGMQQHALTVKAAEKPTTLVQFDAKDQMVGASDALMNSAVAVQQIAQTAQTQAQLSNDAIERSAQLQQAAMEHSTQMMLTGIQAISQNMFQAMASLVEAVTAEKEMYVDKSTGAKRVRTVPKGRPK